MLPPIPAEPDSNRGPALSRGNLVALAFAGLGAVLCMVALPGPLEARGAALAVVCLALWLGEVGPPFVPTLVLWVCIPLLLGGLAPEFSLTEVLGWSANPVLALFLGGFAISAAARRHGVDTLIGAFLLRSAGGHRRRLLALVLCGTAVLSMWMSNIAAAAMMLVALRPCLTGELSDPFRRALLLAVAAGANLGGMATPVGSGPNGLAIAALAGHGIGVSFLEWTLFATPLVAGLLAVCFGVLLRRFKVRGPFESPVAALPRSGRATYGVMAVFGVTVALWLSEPLHGVSSPVVALGAAASLFGTGLLQRDDLSRLDWSTLLLIAGGLSLGTLLEQTGLVRSMAHVVPWSAMPEVAVTLSLVATAAILSALMSNTATAAFLVPLSLTLSETPAVAVVVAVATSLGVPFIISTPQNAMIHGEGGVTAADVFVVGAVVMVFGCLVVGLTGPWVLVQLGVR